MKIVTGSIGIITLFGEIKDSVLSDFSGLGGLTEVHVFFNTTGGNFESARMVFDILKTSTAIKKGYVASYVASGAVLILCAMDHITMPKNSLLNVHLPTSTIKDGNEQFFRKTADTLRDSTEFMLEVYAAKTGKSRDFIYKLLSDSAYLSGETALDLGFVDEVVDEVCLIPNLNGGRLYDITES